MGRHILVEPVQCAGKLRIHPQSGSTQICRQAYSTFWRQPVGWPLQPFAAAKICGQTHIDRQIYYRNRITENNGCLAALANNIQTVEMHPLGQSVIQAERISSSNSKLATINNKQGGTTLNENSPFKCLPVHDHNYVPVPWFSTSPVCGNFL